MAKDVVRNLIQIPKDCNLLPIALKVNQTTHLTLKDTQNHQERFRQWIMGLPSTFNIDFENYRIIEIAKEWGALSINATDRQGDKIISNWFNYIAAKTIQLMGKHGITIYN